MRYTNPRFTYFTCRRQSFRCGTNRPLIVGLSEMLTNAPLFHNGTENEKLIRNPHADPDHDQRLITSRALPAKFGRRPYPRSSVILFTESQTE